MLINYIFLTLFIQEEGKDNLEIDISKSKKQYVEFIIDKAFEYYKNGNNIDLVTGNMEMDAIMLLNRFKKSIQKFVETFKEKLKAWGGNSAGHRLGNMDWAGNVKPDPFFSICCWKLFINTF